MDIFPAIDLYEGKAVRLVKGDFSRLTVYSDDPVSLAEDFSRSGARFLHIVDLEGAKSGRTPNFSLIEKIIKKTPLKVQAGGGVRSGDVVKRYLGAGAARVILGTAAATDPEFLRECLSLHGEKIAVGADLSGGKVAINGWLKRSETGCFDYFERLTEYGVKTVICTDISKDGLLAGPNIPLYRELLSRFSIDIIASGGVTTPGDIKALSALGLCGAVLGKALYNGNISLDEAVKAAKRG